MIEKFQRLIQYLSTCPPPQKKDESEDEDEESPEHSNVSKRQRSSVSSASSVKSKTNAKSVTKITKSDSKQLFTYTVAKDTIHGEDAEINISVTSHLETSDPTFTRLRSVAPTPAREHEPNAGGYFAPYFTHYAGNYPSFPLLGTQNVQSTAYVENEITKMMMERSSPFNGGYNNVENTNGITIKPSALALGSVSPLDNSHSIDVTSEYYSFESYQKDPQAKEVLDEEDIGLPTPTSPLKSNEFVKKLPTKKRYSENGRAGRGANKRLAT